MSCSARTRVAELDVVLRRKYPDAPEAHEFHERYRAAERELQRGAPP